MIFEDPNKQYSQSYYARRQSSYVDFNSRNLQQTKSSNNLLPMITIPYEPNPANNNNKLRHTLYYYFILSLSFCDLFICTIIMPTILLIESGYFHMYFKSIFWDSDNFGYSDLWCRLGFYFVQIPLVLEIEILLTIAIDRYSSVFHPIKIYFFDRAKSKLTLIAQILVSCGLSLPNLFFYDAIKM